MSKKISIIIPTFEPDDYLFDCLQSIKSQTLAKEKFEILIIQNGRRDPYSDYIDEVLKKINIGCDIFSFFSHEVGVSHARNKGLEKATGEYIVFVDDDDILSHNFLECLYVNVQKEAMIASNVRSFVDADKLDNSFANFVTKSFEKNKDQNYNIFKYRKFFSALWGKLIPMSAIKNIRFDSMLELSEDSLFLFALSSNLDNIILTDKNCIYYVRERKDSASRKKRDFSFIVSQRLYVIKKILFLWCSNPFKKNFLFVLSRIIAGFIHIGQKK